MKFQKPPVVNVGLRIVDSVHASQPLATIRGPNGPKMVQDSRDVLTALKVKDVAAILKVSAATVYKLCERGELDHFRVSNSIRVSEAALRSFLN